MLCCVGIIVPDIQKVIVPSWSPLSSVAMLQSVRLKIVSVLNDYIVPSPSASRRSI
jgi:hypothetical protein